MVEGLREPVHLPEDEEGDRQKVPGATFFEHCAGLTGQATWEMRTAWRARRIPLTVWSKCGATRAPLDYWAWA